MRYQLEAIHGNQSKGSFFQVLLPFSSLATLTTIDPVVQRKAKPRKIKKLFDYITSNPDGFHLPSITLTTPGELKYDERGHVLTIDDTQKLSVTDGQHRVLAILMLLDTELGGIYGDNKIGATIFHRMQIDRQIDLFSVMNGEQTPVPKAEREYKNYRNRANRVTHDVVRMLGLSEICEFKTSSVKGKTDKWFAWTWLLEANRWLLNPLSRTDEANAVRRISEFWQIVFAAARPYLGSEEYAFTAASAWVALGQVGRRIITEDDMEDRLRAGIKNVDWRRDGGSFEGSLFLNGEARKSGTSRGGVGTEAQRVLMDALGIPTEK